MRDRRQAASEELGVNRQEEKDEVEKARVREDERRAAKETKRQQLENTTSYRLLKSVKTLMDGPEGFPIGLDAVAGFIIPGGIGDVVTQALNIPSVYVALFKVRSLPLTLAVIYNMLADILKGMVPFFIGDIWDAFNRSFSKNYKIITGYVEDDKEVIEKVEKDATRMGILIVVFCVLIYLMWVMLASLVSFISSKF